MEEDGGRENISVPVPAGYHFRPYPRELVKFYLRRRLLNKSLPCQIIKELNIYDFHPRDILGNTPAGKHLYFFTPRKMKCANGTRPARGTKGGYWRACGKNIIIRDKNKEIGHKKFLVFHEGHQSNAKRTCWLMQEYTINEFRSPTDQNKDKLGALALCEIYLKPTSNKSRDGELHVDEEEEGSASHSPDHTKDIEDDDDDDDNIFVDRQVRPPRPASCNHGKDRGKAPVASSTSGSPSAFSSITARPRPPMPFMVRSHNMVLIPRPSLGPGGLLLQPAAAYHLDTTRMPMFDPEQPGSLVHYSFYCPFVASGSSSSQTGNSGTGASFRNQMMPPPQHMPHGEMSSPEIISVAAASSSQHQVPP